MQSKLAEITDDVELPPGEPLRLPEEAAEILPGHWLGSKKRPVLVLWLDGSDLVAAAAVEFGIQKKVFPCD